MTDTPSAPELTLLDKAIHITGILLFAVAAILCVLVIRSIYSHIPEAAPIAELVTWSVPVLALLAVVVAVTHAYILSRPGKKFVADKRGFRFPFIAFIVSVSLCSSLAASSIRETGDATLVAVTFIVAALAYFMADRKGHYRPVEA